MREEVEALEDHANPRPLPCDVLVLAHVQFALALLEPDELAADPDPATRQSLHLVDQTQEGGLARPAGAEQAHDFFGVNGQVNAFQHLIAAERLGDIDGAYEMV